MNYPAKIIKKKKIINKSDIDGNTMFYIPNYNYGLYNGGINLFNLFRH